MPKIGGLEIKDLNTVQALRREVENRYFFSESITTRDYYYMLDKLEEVERELKADPITGKHDCPECGKVCDCGETDPRNCMACDACAISMNGDMTLDV